MRPSSLLILAALGASTPVLAEQPARSETKSLRTTIALCEGCHGIAGYRTAYPEVYHVPKLGGQSAAYLAAALQAYKSGQRKHPSMRGIAAVLHDKEIAEIAAYYAGSGR